MLMLEPRPGGAEEIAAGRSLHPAKPAEARTLRADDVPLADARLL